jgi:predicted ATP-grasp superfamily ATP-dependent carboligase
MRVLVLDGNQNQAVACVRSLARQNHQVIVGESNRWSKAGWSRYCHRTFQYAAPHQDASDFVARICEIAQEEHGTLVLPMTEATTLPLSAHRDQLFDAGGRIVLPAHADVLRAFNKEETSRLAASFGLRVPRTILVTNEEQIGDAAATVRFPVVLKPQSSVELRSDGAVQVTGRPLYARNEEELLSIYAEMAPRSSRLLLQEFVDGEGTGYFALLNHGEMRAEFAHRRIRDVYPTGSGSSLRVSIEPEPEIRQASLRILRALNWHGLAMVEFRRVPGESPVFMEVNGRFWNSLALACHAGVDFPALLAHMEKFGDVEAGQGLRSGVSCRWLLGDFRHVIEVWRGAPRGYPKRYPGRIHTLLTVLTPIPGAFHDNFQWQDPLPELGDWLAFLQKAGKRLGL